MYLFNFLSGCFLFSNIPLFYLKKILFFPVFSSILAKKSIPLFFSNPSATPTVENEQPLPLKMNNPFFVNINLIRFDVFTRLVYGVVWIDNEADVCLYDWSGILWDVAHFDFVWTHS